MRLVVALALALSSVTGFQNSTVSARQSRSSVARYQIAPDQSALSFRIRHGIRELVGKFTTMAGEIRIDHAAIERSTVTFTVRASSINTNNAERDEHLRSSDFFDVARFPEIVFRGMRVRRAAAGSYIADGEFSLRGITRTIAVPVTASGLSASPSDVIRFSLSTPLNRSDYGMVWNRVLDRGGILIGDEVVITISLTARLVR